LFGPQELLVELVGMLSISSDGIAEGLRLPLGPADVKVAFRAAEHAMAGALRIHRRLRDLIAAAPEMDVVAEEASASRSASQVTLREHMRICLLRLEDDLIKTVAIEITGVHDRSGRCKAALLCILVVCGNA
jgi:hypothetical protein